MSVSHDEAHFYHQSNIDRVLGMRRAHGTMIQNRGARIHAQLLRFLGPMQATMNNYLMYITYHNLTLSQQNSAPDIKDGDLIFITGLNARTMSLKVFVLFKASHSSASSFSQ